MIRRPSISTRTYTLFPDPTRFRSLQQVAEIGGEAVGNVEGRAGEAFGQQSLAGRQAGLRQALIAAQDKQRSEEHTSELQSLMRISSAVFFLKKQKHTTL